MAKKCMYCYGYVNDNSVIDFCDKCGLEVFGKKMLDTIKQRMEEARANGDLTHTPADSFQTSTNLEGQTTKFE